MAKPGPKGQLAVACESCGKVLKDRSGLAGHIRFKHGIHPRSKDHQLALAALAEGRELHERAPIVPSRDALETEAVVDYLLEQVRHPLEMIGNLKGDIGLARGDLSQHVGAQRVLNAAHQRSLSAWEEHLKQTESHGPHAR